MNGYLVMMRLTFDDVPLRFFDSLKEARKFIRESIKDGQPTDELIAKLESVAEHIDFRVSDVTSVDVINIVDGWPVKRMQSIAFA